MPSVYKSRTSITPRLKATLRSFFGRNEGTPNNPPGGLSSTGTLSLYENQPAGTVVGEFNATDPDAGAVMTYHLVSGVGDGNNSLFTLETNGTLRSSVTFDYESNADYAIRVQVKDEHNATSETTLRSFLERKREHSKQPAEWTEFDRYARFTNQPVGTLVGDQCDRSGCRGGSDLSLGEWSGERKHPLYFGHERHAPELSHFRLRSNASSYAIRVQVGPQHNAALEGNFTVLC